MGSSNLTAIDGESVTIQLSEPQRVAALQISGTPGGDASAVFLNISAGSIQDVAGNSNLDNMLVPVMESADIVVPTIERATIDYTTGVMHITASETLQTTPTGYVNLTELFIVDADGATSLTVPLEGPLPNYGRWLDASLTQRQTSKAVVTAVDGVTITVTLTEPQRSAAIEISGAPGGNAATPSKLTMWPGALLDMAGNANLDTTLVLAETPDSAKPLLAYASIDYATGTVVLTASETLDATPHTFMVLASLSIADTCVPRQHAEQPLGLVRRRERTPGEGSVRARQIV